jgi:membrane fusion protein, multidrug efflux system
VKVDLTEGSNLIIGSGLKGGDLVVVDGAEKLKDKAKVEVHAATPNARGNAGLNQLAPRQDQSGNRGQNPNAGPRVYPSSTPPVNGATQQRDNSRAHPQPAGSPK